ncbi:MAG: hypothetical protein ACE5D6_00845 [Candidatus Zixiibacteriota bacterium]
MNRSTNRYKTLVWLFIFIASLISFSLIIISGCTDTLKGELDPNQKPIVNFVNIPPNGQEFSRNPEVFWIGTDNDGQIDYYRYHVIKDIILDEFGDTILIVSNDPLGYADTINDTLWTYVDVDPKVSNPQTANVISLKADLEDPVNTYISQYIFLQAYDDEGEASDIDWLLLNRNDNPPETMIFNISGETPFVNSIFEGGIITGIRLKWEGSDRKDYEDIGLTPPPFDYEWKLFGPYYDNEIDSILANYLVTVFATEDARIFNLGDTLYLVDTIVVDSNILYDTTDIIVFSDTTTNQPFYSRDTLLMIDSADFINSIYYKPDTNSWNGIDTWVQNVSDTIFNVYNKFFSDTTIEMNFIFWIRSRDDAFVVDMTPEFVTFPVVNPQYEREIALIDFTSTDAPHLSDYSNVDVSKAFWKNLIANWRSDLFFDTSFYDTAVNTTIDPKLHKKTGRDYIVPIPYGIGNIPLALLLKHKLIILYNENFKASGFVGPSGISYPEILTAIDAGINVWATMRAPIFGDLNITRFNISVPFLYTKYFGVTGLVYSNWMRYGFGEEQPMMRIEDFIGAYSLDQSQWPDLTVDTALLHEKLAWPPPESNFGMFQWIDSIAALPEVDWSERAFGTEVMYLYKSSYGLSHPLGFIYSFEGSPVGHRLKTSLYKSVHLNFTPLTLDSIQVQQLADNILDWLYDPTLSASKVLKNRYPEAPLKISVDEAREQYYQRLEEYQYYRGNSSN